MGEDDIGYAFTLHCGVHCNFQSVKNERSQSEYLKKKVKR